MQEKKKKKNFSRWEGLKIVMKYLTVIHAILGGDLITMIGSLFKPWLVPIQHTIYPLRWHISTIRDKQYDWLDGNTKIGNHTEIII